MVEIKRRLHEGIYRSSGGGEVRTVREWKNTNPRNLVAAAKLLPVIHKSSVEAYGNVGCGSCWIEIDGKKLDGYEADQINVARLWRLEKQDWTSLRVPTATAYAARLLGNPTQ